MDFFAAEQRARARTRTLVVSFILGVTGLVLSVYLVVLLLYSAQQINAQSRMGLDNGAPAYAFTLWQPGLFSLVSVLTLAVVGGACGYKISELRAGGSAVALSVGAEPMSPHPNDLAEQRLRNIVEEMALASGVPVPQIFIIDSDGINAFAAGFRPEDAAITVTRGSLRYLSRDELQGVIGHEFSHILNGDMRLNLKLVGAVFGLMVLAIIGRGMIYAMGRSRGRNDGAMWFLVLGLALIAIGSLGVFFGRIIQAAVSRERERLADASAQQFTRNPAGLAGALKKIGGRPDGSIIEHAHVQETAHMFIAPAINTMFATHPPLEERIRALEPNWDGKFVTPVPVDGETSTEESDTPPSDSDTPPPVISAVPMAVRAGMLMAPAAAIAAVALTNVRAWRASLPPAIAGALAGPAGCRALVLALAMDDNPARRATQMDSLRRRAEPTIATIASLADTVAALPAGARLPLLELALSSVAATSAPDKASLLAAFRDLTGFDRNPSLHAFAFWRVAECRLQPRPWRMGPPNPESYGPDIAVVLSSLAELSTDDDAAAQPVFEKGLTALPPFGTSLELIPRALATPERVEQACLRLEGAPFPLKKQLLEAGALVAQYDGVIEPAEAELLRGLAASLGCPLPLS
jgi:Zn-dependent protease with chaperone function